MLGEGLGQTGYAILHIVWLQLTIQKAFIGQLP